MSRICQHCSGLLKVAKRFSNFSFYECGRCNVVFPFPEVKTMLRYRILNKNNCSISLEIDQNELRITTGQYEGNEWGDTDNCLSKKQVKNLINALKLLYNKMG